MGQPSSKVRSPGRPVTYKTLYYPIFFMFTYKTYIILHFSKIPIKPIFLYFILDTQETKRLNKSPCIEQDVI